MFLTSPSGLIPIRINRELHTLQAAGRTPWTDGQSCHMAAPYTGQTQTQKRSGQTSTSRVGFEHTIPMFERAMTYHSSERAATHSLLTKLTVEFATNIPEEN
jgi:hypothetical protein